LLPTGWYGHDSSDGGDTVDLTVYLPDLERLFDTTYQGTVVDGEGDVECDVAGEAFTLPLQLVSEMRCTDAGGDVACTHAMDAKIDVAGQLTIGSAIDVPVTGVANVQRVPYTDEVEIEIFFDAPFEDDVPLQRLWVTSPEWPWDRIEDFGWSRRHSDEEGPAVWESCLFEAE
jgi:hypothetical protein